MAESAYGELLKEGLLEKQSPSVLHAWQKRTFRLHCQAILYSAPKAWAPKEKQRILLGRIDGVSHSGKTFEIRTKERGEKKPYKLRAGTDSEAKIWIDAIQDAKLAALTGEWVQCSTKRTIAQIAETQQKEVVLTWTASGASSKLFIFDGRACMEMKGQRFSALMDDDKRIHWSDGDVWELPAPKQIIAGRFELGQRLGAGCFGEVFRSFDPKTGMDMAVKLEEKKASVPQLESESNILQQLTASNGPQPEGFTVPCYFYPDAGPYSALVIPMLSCSLDDCMQKCENGFSAKTALMVAEQCLRRLEYLHSKSIIHRDIKPENFMLGVKEKSHHIYLIDFGVSMVYHDSKGHIPERKGQQFTGTVRYASISSQSGIQQSRRDDLEAVGYMLVFFLRGSLPWSGITGCASMEEKYQKIRERKQSMPLEELCKGFPVAFRKYLEVVRALQFTERPDYNALRGLFRGEFLMAGYSEDYGSLEWCRGRPPQEELLPLASWNAPRQPDDK